MKQREAGPAGNVMKQKEEIEIEIEQVLCAYPICEYRFGETAQIPFSEKVRQICETECERYGHCWACPPYCGDIRDTISRCRKYHKFCMFSTVTEVQDAWNEAECLREKHAHESITRDIAAALRERSIDVYVLSTGCTRCEVCACPDEPCRFPEKRLSSMESHGIVIVKLAEELSMSTSYGSDSIVYFSILFYQETG